MIRHAASMAFLTCAMSAVAVSAVAVSAVAVSAVAVTAIGAQTPQDPFPHPLPSAEVAVRVGIRDFAVLPDVDGAPARMMRLVDEPGTRRLFVNDQRGPLYVVTYDGKTVAEYVNVNDPRWNVGVQSQGRERGVQSFAMHPQFAVRNAPGFGKFYTWSDVRDTSPQPDFTPNGGGHTHHTVLHEWTARTPTATTYDGAPPRELMRFQQPYSNHNGGMIGFNTHVRAGDPDFGLLYIGNGDGGSGGDPQNHGQDLSSGFGKLLRIDPLGTNSTNGRYGLPTQNPFVADNNPATLGEIFAYGLRNPQHFAWDANNGRMFLTDIGQNIVEELDTLSVGSNLGWNSWEGSYRYVNRAISLDAPRSDARMSFPIAEYAQSDPLLQSNSAASGLFIARTKVVPQIANMVVWGDLPSGELLTVSADTLPTGGQHAIRRIVLNHDGTAKTLLQLVREQQTASGKTPSSRVDLRLGTGPEGQLLLLNKADGVIRQVTR